MHQASYNTDFSEWASAQARALAERRFGDLDIEHLTEEVASLGKSERRELKSRIRVLAMHIIKWRVQPGQRSRSWRSTIHTQRDNIGALLEDNPSLRRVCDQILVEVYPTARRSAIEETGIVETGFPDELFFSFTEAMSLILTL